MDIRELPIGTKLRMWIVDRESGNLDGYDAIAVINRIDEKEIEFVDSEGKWLSTITLDGEDTGEEPERKHMPHTTYDGVDYSKHDYPE